MYVIPATTQSHGEPRAVPTCLRRQGQAQNTLDKHRTWGASHPGRMINWDRSSSSSHKSNAYGWWSPILIDKSPQPYYRLYYNTNIDLLHPDHLVGVYARLDHTSKCAETESRSIASRCPKLRTSKGHLVYKRLPAKSQLRSRKPISRHACYNHTRSTHVYYEQHVSLQFSTKYTTLLITLTVHTEITRPWSNITTSM